MFGRVHPPGSTLPRLVCNYCDRVLDERDTHHATSCAHDRITKLEARVDGLMDRLADLGILPENRP